jgi:CRP-like cAMP-binding protein
MRPDVVRDTSCHCGRDAERFVNSGKAVMQEVQRDHMPVILQLFAENVRQASEAAIRHAHREILRFYIRCADPAFARLLIAQLLSRIARMEENILDQLFNSSEKRLARTLLLLAGSGTEARSDGATLKISQGTLAEMVGTTRSRVSFFMNRFRRRFFIEYNGGLRVRRALLTFFLKE